MPATKLYVQENGVLGIDPTGLISMLPLFSFDSFCFDADVIGTRDPSAASWGWFLDSRLAAQVVVVDDSAIGCFDLALAISAQGLMPIGGIGDVTVREIDEMFGILQGFTAKDHCKASWIDAVDAQELLNDRAFALQNAYCVRWPPFICAQRLSC